MRFKFFGWLLLELITVLFLLASQTIADKMQWRFFTLPIEQDALNVPIRLFIFI